MTRWVLLAATILAAAMLWRAGIFDTTTPEFCVGRC